MWEAVHVHELFLEGVVDVVVRLLKVVVQLHDIALVFLLHYIRGHILNDGLPASL